MRHTLCRDCCRLSGAGQDICPDCGSTRLISHDEITELGIAHVDCDAFYASVEKRDRPELRDQPLIVGHAGGRGVVTTACYLARRYGVHSAMPMFRALELCPHAAVVPPEMAKYKRVSAEVRAIFLSATSVIEPVSLDEAYLDLTAAHRTGERPAALALAGIAARIERETGITVSIGLAWNKFLAKLASDMNKPRGFTVIGRADTKEVLPPLSVRKINGVGDALAKRLEAIGVTTIGQLQALSEMQLVTQFGKFGRRLALFAHGEDGRRVTPHRPAKSISAETTFRQDIGAADALCAAVAPLCERVAAQLLRNGLAGGAVILKLKTSDFVILTRSKRLPDPTQRARVLAETAERLIRKEADGRAFRLIGIGVDELRPAAEADPPDLFGET
jgi:DNA polymerase-4